MLWKYLAVFFVSMVPVVELRGAIPIGIGMGLPMLPTYVVAVIGNMLPVPFIYLFARKFLIWGCDKPLIGGICRFLQDIRGYRRDPFPHLPLYLLIRRRRQGQDARRDEEYCRRYLS